MESPTVLVASTETLVINKREFRTAGHTRFGKTYELKVNDFREIIINPTKISRRLFG
jgi:hypothetical protein